MMAVRRQRPVISFVIALALTAFVAHAYGSSAGEPAKLRLISFAENDNVWMDQAEVFALMDKQVKFIDITDFQEAGKSIKAPPPSGPIPDQPNFKELVRLIIPTLSIFNIGNTINDLTKFHTRYYTSETGVQSANFIFESLVKITETYPENDVSIERIAHNFPQPSICATLFGDDRNEFVVIGGHQDSYASPTSGPAPGADDDASGSATVLEIFRALLEFGYFPEKSVKFYFYAAEEAGLLGSQAVANEAARDDVDVFAALQLDMTGYSGSNMAQPIGIITDFVDVNVTQFVRILIDTYLDLGWTNSVCGYGCSDHASWTRVGYRSAFPFETAFPQRNPHIHTAQDTADKLDPRRVLEFAKLGLSFVVELAGQAIHTD